MNIVLQKYIAQSGVCSRRKAEELIKKGKIKINDQIAKLGDRVTETDKVFIGSQKIGLNKEKIYIILNKPVGYTCTNRRFKGEKNVFELVSTPPTLLVGIKNTPLAPLVRGEAQTPLDRGESARLVAAGRLDKDSRGLVLLTNDGELVNKITHPKYGHEKEYIANVKCQISNVELILEKFKKGIDIGEGDGIVKVKEINYLGNDKFKVILTEGKKRQIRRMFKKIGCEVIDLNRIRIGKIILGSLKMGEWKKLDKLKI